MEGLQVSHFIRVAEGSFSFYSELVADGKTMQKFLPVHTAWARTESEALEPRIPI